MARMYYRFLLFVVDEVRYVRQRVRFFDHFLFISFERGDAIGALRVLHVLERPRVVSIVHRFVTAASNFPQWASSQRRLRLFICQYPIVNLFVKGGFCCFA